MISQFKSRTQKIDPEPMVTSSSEKEINSVIKKKMTDIEIIRALTTKIAWIFVEFGCLLMILPASPVLLVIYLVFQALSYLHTQLPDVLDNCQLGIFGFMNQSLKSITQWWIMIMLIPITCAAFSLFTVFLGPIIIPLASVYHAFNLIAQLRDTFSALISVLLRITKAKLALLYDKLLSFRCAQAVRAYLGVWSHWLSTIASKTYNHMAQTNQKLLNCIRPAKAL